MGQSIAAIKSLNDFVRILNDLHLAFDHQVDRPTPRYGMQIRIVGIEDNDTHVLPPYVCPHEVHGLYQQYVTFVCIYLDF